MHWIEICPKCGRKYQVKEGLEPADFCPKCSYEITQSSDHFQYNTIQYDEEEDED